MTQYFLGVASTIAVILAVVFTADTIQFSKAKNANYLRVNSKIARIR